MSEEFKPWKTVVKAIVEMCHKGQNKGGFEIEESKQIIPSLNYFSEMSSREPVKADIENIESNWEVIDAALHKANRSGCFTFQDIVVHHNIVQNLQHWIKKVEGTEGAQAPEE